MNIYLVGGAVRDKLLGQKIKERDYVVVGATEQEMLAKNFIKVGKDFPVFLHPETKEEYALARKEKKTGKGYYGFECDTSKNVTLEEDLKRRDITINAMAEDKYGNLIDPYNGKQDLENKIIKHVSDAFVEDPLRVLRVARFKAKLHHLGFKIAQETYDVMKEISSGKELSLLTKERIWLEMHKALAEKSPQEFFIALKQCNALIHIFPELDQLWGIPQNPEYHPEIDSGVHVMMALEQAAKLTSDTRVRFAVLCHDLGKGITPKEQLPSHKEHDFRGIDLIRNWCNQNRVPNTFKTLAILVCKYHIKCHSLLDNLETAPEKALNILEGLDAFRKSKSGILDKFVLACFADVKGRKGKENITDYPQGDFLKKAFLTANQISILDLEKEIDIYKCDINSMKGENIGKALRLLKLKAIKNM